MTRRTRPLGWTQRIHFTPEPPPGFTGTKETWERGEKLSHDLFCFIEQVSPYMPQEEIMSHDMAAVFWGVMANSASREDHWPPERRAEFATLATEHPDLFVFLLDAARHCLRFGYGIRQMGVEHRMGALPLMGELPVEMPEREEGTKEP